MRALIRYQAELLLRSYGWLPPFLAYALLMVIGVSIGDPLLGSQAVGAAVLLPVTAWLVRVAVTAEPAASRACLAAAATGPRVHLAALLSALSAGLLLAAGGTFALLTASGPVSNPKAPPAPVGEAVPAGFLASVVCVLLGVAVGALCNRPVLLRGQYGIPLALAAATLVLVAPPSPARRPSGSWWTPPARGGWGTRGRRWRWPRCCCRWPRRGPAGWRGAVRNDRSAVGAGAGPGAGRRRQKRDTPALKEINMAIAR
ncbi:ABC transporter [Kitasatospora sp. NBC_00240]|uniref:ABC transporter n=1 Tax=Kitasatospora sp. NBC_00240 TaxID=2903567 RepID=UPI00224FB78E|nr:ABC transporter [Kitasatospora sp. NBC_00240]MCX5211141.1 ABC transporter [Kitasatospora sp. NBC_00240]